jgi:N-sulfoglucosamine sulfohydrolase
LDYAGGLDLSANKPKKYGAVVETGSPRQAAPNAPQENVNGGTSFDFYHGRSWLSLLAQPDKPHWETIFASHTFHEIQMYYPMRVVRDAKYKLIWNIAHPLPYPFASDLWTASSWQAQFKQGPEAKYGTKTVHEYIHRPQFELFDIQNDPLESTNLAGKPEFQSVLVEYQKKLKEFQRSMDDPWIIKWDYE